MKKLLFLFVLISSLGKTQTFPCNLSAITPSFYITPGAVNTYTNPISDSYWGWHYICPTAVLYDTLGIAGDGRGVMVDAGATYYWRPAGGALSAIFVKNGGTLVIKYQSYGVSKEITTEPGAIIMDPAGMLFSPNTTTYSCALITLPTVNCFAGIEENSKSNLVFSSWPNPVNNLLQLEIINSETDLVDVKILNQLGEVVLDIPKWNTSKKEIEVEKLASGVYYLNVKSGRNTAVKKIVVMK